MRASEPRLLYSLRSAADQLDVSERFLRDEIDHARLAAVRIGKRGVRIEHEALEAWIAARKVDAA